MIKTIVTGRITQDLELKEVWDNKVLNFSVASQNKFKNKETDEYESTFLNCSVWNKTAETIAQFFNKGDWITLDWDITSDTVENDDWKRTYYKLNVSWFEFQLCRKWDWDSAPAKKETKSNDDF